MFVIFDLGKIGYKIGVGDWFIYKNLYLLKVLNYFIYKLIIKLLF